jgi:hypothetical protein
LQGSTQAKRVFRLSWDWTKAGHEWGTHLIDLLDRRAKRWEATRLRPSSTHRHIADSLGHPLARKQSDDQQHPYNSGNSHINKPLRGYINTGRLAIECRVGEWPRLFDLSGATQTNKDAPSFRVLRERVRMAMCAQRNGGIALPRARRPTTDNAVPEIPSPESTSTVLTAGSRTRA